MPYVFNEEFSTLKYSATPITDKFTATTKDNEIILFERENNRILTCSTLTISADDTDLYFAVFKGNVYMDCEVLKNLDGTDYDFTNAQMFMREANDVISLNGLDATGIQLNNLATTRLLINGIGYFSDDRYSSNALSYEIIREQTTGTQMRVSTVNPNYATLRDTPNNTSTVLAKIPNGTIVDIIDLVLGVFVQGTYYWAVVEYNNQVGYVNYNSLVPYVL